MFVEPAHEETSLTDSTDSSLPVPKILGMSFTDP